MKRFCAAVVFCFVIGSFIAACATTANDNRGNGGKMSRPKPAREEVVPNQPAPAPTDEAVYPQDTPSKPQ